MDEQNLGWIQEGPRLSTQKEIPTGDESSHLCVGDASRKHPEATVGVDPLDPSFRKILILPAQFLQVSLIKPQQFGAFLDRGAVELDSEKA